MDDLISFLNKIIFNVNGFDFSVIDTILLGFAISFALWQIIFHYYYFLKIYRFKSKVPDPEFCPPVSIVICAKNEKENLRENLSAILEQDYPDFEVVVVNDASWDGTDEILKYFEEKYPHLKIVEVREDIKRIDGKKFPLTMGIKAAKNELLLLSDADCKPVSNDWIRWMIAPYENEKIELVLGYSPYQNGFGLLNLFIRAETSLTAMLYFSFALARKPYMGVGRNLSYKRSLFFKHKGFASHHHIPAGDDDLFVRDSATAYNTAVVLHPNARILTKPKNKVAKWIKQKRRHLFVGKFYNPNIKRSLSAFSFSHFFFWTFIFCLLALSNHHWLTLGIIGAKWILQWPVVFLAFKKLGYRLLALFMPLLDIAYIAYALFSALVLFFSKKPKW